MVKRLDANLRSLAEVIASDIGIDVQAIPGSGAAGGMGGGMAHTLTANCKWNRNGSRCRPL